jgi:hypothetical protein
MLEARPRSCRKTLLTANRTEPTAARVLTSDALRGCSKASASPPVGYALIIARRLRALHPDIVHTNSLKSGVYGSIAGLLAGVAVVWHLRDNIDDDYLRCV